VAVAVGVGFLTAPAPADPGEELTPRYWRDDPASNECGPLTGVVWVGDVEGGEYHRGLCPRKPEGAVPYALWVYCALLPWQLLQSSLAIGVPSLVQFAGVIRKVYVPREAFPLSAVVTSNPAFSSQRRVSAR